MAAFSTSWAVVGIPSLHSGRVSRMLLTSVRTLVQLLLGRVQELVPAGVRTPLQLQQYASRFLQTVGSLCCLKTRATYLDLSSNRLLTVVRTPIQFNQSIQSSVSTLVANSLIALSRSSLSTFISYC